jgi:hypothetical protein
MCMPAWRRTSRARCAARSSGARLIHWRWACIRVLMSSLTPSRSGGGVPTPTRNRGSSRLHATASTLTPAVVHVAIVLRRIGRLWDLGLSRSPLGAPGERQHDEECSEPFVPVHHFLRNAQPSGRAIGSKGKGQYVQQRQQWHRAGTAQLRISLLAGARARRRSGSAGGHNRPCWPNIPRCARSRPNRGCSPGCGPRSRLATGT